MQPLPFLALLTLVPQQPQQFVRDGAPRLERVAVIPTSAPGAEIFSVQASTLRGVLTHSQSGQIELFDLADPAKPRTVRVFDLGLGDGEEVTSVALPPSGEWFLAVVKAKKALAPGRAVVHALADGARLATFPCGVGPDCVTISKSGALALVANEAEEFDDVGPDLVSAPGSLTLIRFAADVAQSVVVQIPLERAAEAPTDGRALERLVDDKEEDIPLGSGPEFLEPEVVLVLPDEQRALVSLQENNQVAFLDLAAGRLERYVPLGITTHPADLLADGRFDERGVLSARREPDGIALTPDGRFFVTADEGDTGPSLEKTAPGKPSGGGRTLSVFELATGRLMGDTGPELDRIAAAADLYPDKRSTKKGCEPEMVLCLELAGVPYAAVTLERAGALVLVDLRDPSKPIAVAVTKTGSDHLQDEPEGLAHLSYPDGKADYLYVANEGTGTLGVLRVPR